MSARDKRVQHWLHKVDHDLKSAVVCAREGLYDTACFHCQQATEKVIKAFLIHRDVMFEKIHDIEELIAVASQYDATWAPYEESAGFLTDYATIGRYDTHDPSETDYAAAIAEAQRVVAFARGLLVAPE